MNFSSYLILKIKFFRNTSICNLYQFAYFLSTFRFIFDEILAFEFLLGPVNRLGGLVVIAPARRAGDSGSNPGPGENFFS